MTLAVNAIDTRTTATARASCNACLTLPFSGITLQVRADHPAILDALSRYYAGLTATGSDAAVPTQCVFLVNRPVETEGLDWTPVRRNTPSPLGLKEAFLDTVEGRWIHKVRTGMVFLQTLDAPLAMGDLTRHFSQVVNFINNQFLNHQQRSGYLLGHASAFTVNGQAIAIAAGSGGGKSTLMLKALERPGARFLSNDRIVFKALPGRAATKVLGVAKHPRVNPGTLVTSLRLAGLLSNEEYKHFAQMPTTRLWNVEQKYDVLIPDVYGEDKTALSGQLKHLVLLDWSLDASRPTALHRLDTERMPGALEGLRKGSGPFFQRGDGSFPVEQAPSCQVYAGQLPGVAVYRLSGRVDFERALTLLEAEGVLA